jgi:hypothetical protein
MRENDLRNRQYRYSSIDRSRRTKGGSAKFKVRLRYPRSFSVFATKTKSKWVHPAPYNVRTMVHVCTIKTSIFNSTLNKLSFEYKYNFW